MVRKCISIDLLWILLGCRNYWPRLCLSKAQNNTVFATWWITDDGAIDAYWQTFNLSKGGPRSGWVRCSFRDVFAGVQCPPHQFSSGAAAAVIREVRKGTIRMLFEEEGNHGSSISSTLNNWLTATETNSLDLKIKSSRHSRRRLWKTPAELLQVTRLMIQAQRHTQWRLKREIKSGKNRLTDIGPEPRHRLKRDSYASFASRCSVDSKNAQMPHDAAAAVDAEEPHHPQWPLGVRVPLWKLELYTTIVDGVICH